MHPSDLTDEANSFGALQRTLNELLDDESWIQRIDVYDDLVELEGNEPWLPVARVTGQRSGRA